MTRAGASMSISRYPEASTYLHVDHKVPRCKAGPSETNNLQALCSSCNARKAGRDV